MDTPKTHLKQYLFVIFLITLLLSMTPTSFIGAQEATPTSTETPTLPIETPTAMVIDTPTMLPTDIPTETATSVLTDTPSATNTEPPTVDIPTETATTQVLPTEAPLSLLLSDNFDSGDTSQWILGSGWSVVPSEAGNALQVFNSPQAAIVNTPDRLNVAVQGRFQTLDGTIELRVRESVAGYYAATLAPDGTVSLYRGLTMMQTMAVTPSMGGQWRVLHLSAIDNVVRVAVDGLEVIVVVDAASLPAGHVSLQATFPLVAPEVTPTAPINTLLVDDIALWIPTAEIVIQSTPTPTLAQTTVVPIESNTPDVTGSVSPLDLVYIDSFDMGSLYTWALGTGWGFAPDGFGQFLQVTNSNAPLLFSRDIPSDVATQIRFQLDNSALRLNLRQSSVATYTVTVDTSGQVQLYRANSLMSSAMVALIAAGQWHTLYTSFTSNVLRVLVDGIEVIQIADNAPLPPGTISVATAGMGILRVDDFMLWVQRTPAVTDALSDLLVLGTAPLPPIELPPQTQTQSDMRASVTRNSEGNYTDYAIVDNLADFEAAVNFGNYQYTGTALFRIYMLPGIYYLDHLYLFKNIALYGQGIDVTVIQPIAGSPDRMSMMQVVTNSRLEVHNLTIRGGVASGGGGGIVTSSGSLGVYDSKIEDNQAVGVVGIGGAIRFDDLIGNNYPRPFHLDIQRSIIVRNSASYFDGAVSVRNFVDIGFPSPIIAISCVLFRDNISTNAGGGAVRTLSYDATTIHESSFINNDVSVNIAPNADDVSALVLPYGTIDITSNWWGDATGPDINSSRPPEGFSLSPLLTNYEPFLASDPVWFYADAAQQNASESARQTLYSTESDCVMEQPSPIPPQSCDSAPLECEEVSDQLNSYNVDAPNPQDTAVWTVDELDQLLLGVIATGQALQQLTGTTYSTPDEAFRAVMLFDPTDRIEFRRNGTSPYNCSTSKLDPNNSNGYMARVSCGNDVSFTQYTAVHELGHVFVHRTTRIEAGQEQHPCVRPLLTTSFNSCIERPVQSNGDNAALEAPSYVFGYQSYRLTRGQVQFYIDRRNVQGVTPENFQYSSDERTSLRDWDRGAEGWGSGAPVPGPCAGAATSQQLPTNFQQNPCVFVNWLETDTGGVAVTEIEETAADMFLNWVYRDSVLATPTIFGDEGFENSLWANWVDRSLGTSGASPNGSNLDPGQDRFNWINDIMLQFVAYYNW